jgi:hypothetical protein
MLECRRNGRKTIRVIEGLFATTVCIMPQESVGDMQEWRAVATVGAVCGALTINASFGRRGKQLYTGRYDRNGDGRRTLAARRHRYVAFKVIMEVLTGDTYTMWTGTTVGWDLVICSWRLARSRW